MLKAGHWYPECCQTALKWQMDRIAKYSPFHAQVWLDSHDKDENFVYELKNGHFHFGQNCIGCVRCSFRCPAGAIHIGLLDFMRVNGPYDFDRDPSNARIGRYCRRAYQRYFDNSGPEEK